MSLVENRPARATARLLVVAADGGERSRIRCALSKAGQEPVAAVADLRALTRHRVDEASVLVVACDVDRPAEVTALRKLSRAAGGAAIVVVSPQVTATAVRRTLDAGADALVFEPELEGALIPTLRAVESGQSAVPRNLRAGVESPYLSYRERQVLNLVREGLTNGEIARTLVLAESTIKSHLASIFTKFGVHSRKEAVAAFAESNLAHAEAAAEDARR
ncbi:MAG TPA: response regulator transcription factor [Solirubrobacterales bacterium]|nr:response regulator transcription factor [Solirubrobacterales bacterium]